MKDEYVSRKIAQLLDKRGWTLEQLAEKADVSYAVLQTAMQQNEAPSVSAVIRICEAFGITMSDFFDEGMDSVSQVEVSDQQLFVDIHHVPRDDKKLVSAYMKGLAQLGVTSGTEDEACR